MKLDYQNIISKVYTDIIAKENFGKVPSYIPELACIDDNKFGINFTDLKHNSFGIGDFEEKFSIQSISKVFALSFVYEKLDEKLWKRVDVEPSGSAFNSLVQLEADCGIPRNPFINAGALVICDILLEICNNPKQELIQFIRDLTGDQQIFFNEKEDRYQAEKIIGDDSVYYPSWEITYMNGAWYAWQARVPEGYVVVPKEPTDEMISKAQEETPHFYHGDSWYGTEEISEGQVISCYKSMIEAVEK